MDPFPRPARWVAGPRTLLDVTPRAASGTPAAILPARRFDAMAALSVVVTQVAWWPLRPGWLDASPAGRGLWVVLPLACLAGVVVGLRRDNPERAVAGALVCAVLGLAVPAAAGSTVGLRPADLLCGPVAVVLTVYSLAVYRTAAVSVIGAGAIPVVGAGYDLGRGAGIRPPQAPRSCWPRGSPPCGPRAGCADGCWPTGGPYATIRPARTRFPPTRLPPNAAGWRPNCTTWRRIG